MPLHHVRVRRAISRAVLPDTFTHALYRVTPYQGCAHGCSYCDGRAEKYYVEGDFERDIVVRDNVPELFTEELPRLREQGMIVFGSGTTDPYQPCEMTEKLTGRCAAALVRFPETQDAASVQQALFPEGGPVRPSAMVLTKSSLVQRDLPLWRRVNELSGFLLLMTVTGTDERVRKHFEPGASPVKDRLDTLVAFRGAGIPVGVLAMPLLPGVNDDPDSLRDLYATCMEIGVEFIMPGGLTLRPGRQKTCYLDSLSGRDPSLLSGTEALYSEERASGRPRSYAIGRQHGLYAALHREFRIPWLLPHRVFRRLLPPHDSLRVLLQDMIELYRAAGEDAGPLRGAAKRYDAWLTGLRRTFRRRRSLPQAWLEERFTGAAANGELARILDNQRTVSLVERIVREGAVFDYTTLRLEDGTDG